MGLLNGDIANLFAKAFEGMYLDGLLHAGTAEPIYDAAGNITGYTDGGDTDIKVQTDRTGEGVKASDGYARGDVTLIILARNGDTVITINTDQTVTDGYGTTYRIQDVDQDAARSHWVCLGRPV
jgi:hypothetical protein